ncbi:MAG: EamA family transporter [Oscillospiraceae bacterium]|nr:EamA family transporter [Oscillospiraceae bacterium]
MKLGEKSGLTVGIAAVFVWAVGFIFIRGLTETLGVMTAGALPNILGGTAVLIFKAKTTGIRIKDFRETPRAYWPLCGLMFLAFSITVNVSVGIATTNEQVVTSGLFRLVWPLLALIMTIPLYKRRVNRWFIFSVSLSFIGLILGNVSDGFTPRMLIQSFGDIWIPSLVALFSSVCWAFYSNFLGKYVTEPRFDHLGWFMLASGLIQGAAAVILGETPVFGTEQVLQILFIGLVTGFLANTLWVFAMQSKYNHAIILIANFTPLISTVAVALGLGVPVTLPLVIGSALIAVGTIWSKYCFLPGKEESALNKQDE